MQILENGQKAPTFCLQNQINQTICLENYQKQLVLLYFYPKALTPGCTTQACSLRDSMAELNNLGVKVIGISGDSPEKLLKFQQKHQLNFDLLSDPDFTVCKSYGVYGEKKFMGKTFNGIIRTSFLISPNGEIQHIFAKFKTADHHKIVLDYIENL